MALDHHPVQNSEVYLLNSSPHPVAMAPPSPPTPAVFCDRELSPPLEDDLMALTPPETQASTPIVAQRISRAVHVLSTEATALSQLTRLYETDLIAQEGLSASVETIKNSIGVKGKLVVSGVGKSGHIAKKMVATMNSLKIHATYLHPTEAVHGDLGKIGQNDTILLITFSGKTPELQQLLPYLDQSLPVIIMTSHTNPSTCELIRQRPGSILLPAPIHESEVISFGVSAPTTSTTMAIAMGDALSIVIAQEIHPSVAAVFSQNHPGGAIGAAFKGPQKLAELSVSLAEIPDLSPNSSGAHVLMSAYRSESGWIRQGNNVIMPPRRIKRLQPDDMDEDARMIKGLMVHRSEWICMPAATDIQKAIAIIRGQTESPILDDTIIALTEDDEIGGFLEVADLMN